MSRFAEFYKPLQRTPQGLSSMVPWRATVAPGVVLCHHRHALLRGYVVRGIDVIGEQPETIGARMLQANNALKRLSGAWTLQAEAQRTRLTTYPQRTARFAVAGLIDADRQRVILHEPGTMETRYYCTLTWTPPQGARNALQEFYAAADGFMAHLQNLLAVLRPLDTPELLAYLKTTVSSIWQPVAEPLHETQLGRYLCDSSWSAGRYPDWDATLGPWHVRVLTLLGYPGRSWATMMQRLEAMAVPFRWCTRWAAIEKHLQDGILHERQKDWLGTEKTPWQHWKESTTKRPQRLINEDATRKTEDLSSARQDIGADIYGLGQFSTTILTWSDTADDAEHQVRQIQHTLQGLGFITKREGDYGSRLPITTKLLSYLAPPHHTAAFLSTQPGNTIDNIRQTMQSTLTVSHLLPGLKAVWPGPEEDEYLGEPPWFLAHTEGSSVVRVVNHVRQDVGHFMMFGPTGSGKSTLLLFCISQWLLYRSTQATIFDVGRTARLLTLMVGGEWIDLGAGTMPLQPLRHIDDPAEMRWALEWLLRIVEQSGVTPTGIVQSYLAERLRQLAGLPANQRTFTALLRLCDDQTRRVEERVSKGTRDAQGLSHPDTYLRQRVELQRDVQRALRPFVRTGEYGAFLDGVQETLMDSHLVVFEQKELLNTPRVLEPVIQYCFHMTERRFSTDRPMLMAMEEAALVAALPLYRDRFDQYLMTTRKAGVSMGFIINSLQQTARFNLGLLTEENCPARFFLGDTEAMTPQTAKVYELFGLTSEEMRLIATARPYEETYYIARGYGRRMFQLHFSPFILDCLAKNDDADHALMDEILEKEGREGFAAAWLRQHGYQEEAQQVEQFQQGVPLCLSHG